QNLSFDTFAVTMMACPQEDVMEQETAYLSTLTKVTRYTIDGNNLLLFDANDLVIAQFSQ
ncbi:MAG TPA: META domain-containing protein, partial [Anaerolineaceae bacterium]|nr:META domain-containing protein [Anaerolineaceae bacterium]